MGMVNGATVGPVVASGSVVAAGHKKLKRIRGRGCEGQGHLASYMYLRELEAELVVVQNLVLGAWQELEGSRDFKKFLRHSDQAQQRLHKAIKKLNR